MAFQPYDNRMFKIDRDDNKRILYDCMLELENLEHMSHKCEVGFFQTTVKQIFESKKCKLTTSQIRTAIKNLIKIDIIVQTEIGSASLKTPSVFYLTEVINRNIVRNIVDNDKSQHKKKNKATHIKLLKACHNITLTTYNRNMIDNISRNLLKEGLKDVKKTILKDKGIEKDNNNLSFMQELELFGQGSKFKNDEVYFDDKQDIYK